MTKIRLTKNELKKQKEALKRSQRYLPMLQLKKKRLQLEISKLHQTIQEVSGESERLRNEVVSWVDVFSEEVPFSEFFSFHSIKTGEENVAGIDLPVFLGVEFTENPYDLLCIPLWVDKATEVIKKNLTLKAKLAICHRQLHILKEELRIATQRVNLFEKVKIPEARENIRIIHIYLGELQTAGVIRGKIAKAKIEQRKNLVGV